MEFWKDVNFKKFGKKYEVSNFANVRNKLTKRILIGTQRNGYLSVSLSDILKVSVPIHRLVAMTFLSNEENKEFVNHIDGDKLNNKLENLEWTTPKENTAHAILAGLTKSHPTKVLQFDKNGILIKEFDSIQIASQETGANDRHISAVCKGKRKSTGGFLWEYSDDKNLIQKIDVTINHKNFTDFPNYDISENGKVYSNKSKKYLVQKLTDSGYYVVKLCNKGVMKDMYVHILVAMCFVKGKKDGYVVNHKDGNKINNSAENLEWVSQLENSIHYQKYLKKSNTKPDSKNQAVVDNHHK